VLEASLIGRLEIVRGQPFSVGKFAVDGCDRCVCYRKGISGTG
jgi:hypothetical protein